MKSLVFSAAMITGEEPQTTNALALLSTLVKNNLDIDEHNPLRIVFGMIRPGEIQTVRSIVALRLRDIFDDWGKTHGKTYRFYTDDSNPNELCYIFYINNEDQKEVRAEQPTNAPSVVDSSVKLEWVEHKHRPVKPATFVDDLLISNETGEIVPFFHSSMETLCVQTEMVKRLFYTQFFNKEGLLDVLGESNRAGDVVKKLFKFNTVSYDEFLAFKPFMNFSESSHQTYPWGESFVSQDGTVLLRVRKLSSTSDMEYSHWYTITKKEEKQLCRPVDYIEKLNELYKVCFKPKEEKGDEKAE